MCGIAGAWSFDGTGDAREDAVRRMTTCISHRGPDDHGYWSDDAAGIGLGHRRLSILDMSPSGHQPMASRSSRFVTVFNGEIYNFRELRDELAAGGATFRGHSDTEVMLAAFERWGVVPTVGRMAGMFALAVWDRAERVLHLIRDRLGEKPLYYGWVGDTFVFGSELKALRAHPKWQGNINRGALALFLRHNYVPAPYSIYSNIRKVLPGTALTFRSSEPGHVPTLDVYWSARDMTLRGSAQTVSGTDEELIAACEARLSDTIRQEMIADVPLGAFLSGGIDSSLIVALMQANSTRAVKTFTIGFHVPEFNEAEHAREVAAHLGTEHTELYVTPEETLNVIPRLPALYDEPFADSSQIPTFLVAQLARQHVTVALSGDGGDELFGGYNRYFLGQRIWGKVRRIPRSMRRGVASGLRAVSPQRWDKVFATVGGVLPGGPPAMAGDRIHKLAGVLSADTQEQLYHDIVSHWPDPRSVALGHAEHGTVLTDPSLWPQLPEFASRMMYLDLVSYLPDDILVKVDRATMGVSLESRAPFLDHRVVEFAWSLPHHVKVRDGVGKWILREVLAKHVPRRLFERPKMGFGVPIDRWLRGPLRAWAEELLDPSRLRQEGYFDERAVTEKWQEHQSGSRNWQYLLWDVLMFQAWLRA
ncbi:MAG: asparagine synthase (glutamine-hydrolyzing) [Gemmatimonadaceae bacterium]